MYGQYYSNFDTARATLKRCNQRPAVQEFLQVCDHPKQRSNIPQQKQRINHRTPIKQSFRTGKHNMQALESLLIQPVQRVPRYKMLLQDLVKKSPPTHPDHSDLVSALEKMTGLAEQLDDTIKKASHIKEFAAVMKRIKNHKVSLSPFSPFIHSFIHSFILQFIHSAIHSFIHSFDWKCG